MVQQPNEFKRDMAKFYGVDKAETKNVDLAKIMVKRGGTGLAWSK